MKQINMETFFTKLGEKRLTISSCESFTGGLFANTITNTPGASKVFKGSIVAYSDEAKIKLVGVNARTIKKYGAISPETSRAMAEHTQKIFKSGICVSFTGNADTDVIENGKPFFGYLSIAIGKNIRTFEINTDNEKNMNRKLFKEIAVNYALNKVLELLG